MQRREMWLAYMMLAPTFAIILMIAAGPLLANFWISFKPVQLADLRPPAVLVNERMRGNPEAAGDAATLEYRMRNSSQDEEIRDVVVYNIGGPDTPGQQCFSSRSIKISPCIYCRTASL